MTGARSGGGIFGGGSRTGGGSSGGGLFGMFAGPTTKRHYSIQVAEARAPAVAEASSVAAIGKVSELSPRLQTASFS